MENAICFDTSSNLPKEIQKDTVQRYVPKDFSTPTEWIIDQQPFWIHKTGTKFTNYIFKMGECAIFFHFPANPSMCQKTFPKIFQCGLNDSFLDS